MFPSFFIWTMEFQHDPARWTGDCSSQLPTITSVSSKGCGGAVLRKMDEKVAQQPWRKIEVKAQGRYVDSYMKLIKVLQESLLQYFRQWANTVKRIGGRKWHHSKQVKGVKITFTIPLTACSNIHRMLKLQHPAVIGENHGNVACYQVSLRGTNKWSANCPRSTGYGKAGGMWYTPPRKVWDLGTVQALGMQWCRTYGSKPYLSDFHQQKETKSCQHMIQEIPIQALLQVKNLVFFHCWDAPGDLKFGTILFLAKDNLEWNERRPWFIYRGILHQFTCISGNIWKAYDYRSLRATWIAFEGPVYVFKYQIKHHSTADFYWYCPIMRHPYPSMILTHLKVTSIWLRPSASLTKRHILTQSIATSSRLMTSGQKTVHRGSWWPSNFQEFWTQGKHSIKKEVQRTWLRVPVFVAECGPLEGHRRTLPASFRNEMESVQ